MEWVNIHAPMLRAPEYIGSEPISRATWFNVLVYCCEQENGGRIISGATWKDRQWQQTCGVTRDEVVGAGLLLIVDGDDIVVWRYPSDKEHAVREQREAGKRGGRPPKTTPEKPSENPRVNPVETQGVTLPRNGREGKGRGMEEEGKGIPPNPQGGDGTGENLIPKNTSKTDLSKRIASIFHRRHDTAWSDKEISAFKKLGVIDGDDLALIEDYYEANWPPERERNILRHDLKTFLNNFQGEVDRARQWAQSDAVSSQPGTVGNPYL